MTDELIDDLCYDSKQVLTPALMSTMKDWADAYRQTLTRHQHLRITKAVLVYQGGLANVFQVSCFNLSPYGRDAKRLWQSDFRSAALFAKGLMAAGTIVKVAACNEAGDISERTWTDDLESQPFSDSFASIGYSGKPPDEL